MLLFLLLWTRQVTELTTDCASSGGIETELSSSLGVFYLFFLLVLFETFLIKTLCLLLF